jgi:ribosomal-protein-alanine N-acetyltransferase
MSADDSMPIILCPAGPECAHQIASLHAELFSPAWDATAIAELLGHSGSMALLAKAGPQHEPTGFAIARRAADEAEILSVGVAARCQRRAVGARLLSGLCELAATHGVRKLFLEVAADNEAALRLYHAQGFSEIGRRKGYYDRRRTTVDAIVMSKDLRGQRTPVDGSSEPQL